MTIWKFQIETTDVQVVLMPDGAEVLCVQLQGGLPCLWARVDQGAPLSPRKFYVYGTGHECAKDSRYVGTYQLAGGGLIFHVFE